MSHGHDYSESQIDFLRANRTLGRKELTQAFNQAFLLNLSEMAIKGTCSRNKIYTGRDGRFPKGSSSWNTGRLVTWVRMSLHLEKAISRAITNLLAMNESLSMVLLRLKRKSLMFLS